MAKGSKRSNGRDASHSALTPRLRSHPSLPLPRLTSNLKGPASSPARLFSGQPAKFTITSSAGTKKKPATKASFRTAQVAFSAPPQTVICVRRSRRKEVLHALKKTGKRGQRKPRRSSWRNYKC